MRAAPSFCALGSVPLDDPPHTSDSGRGSHPARHHPQASMARLFPSTPPDRSPDQRFVLSSLWMTLSETRGDATERKPEYGDARSLEPLTE